MTVEAVKNNVAMTYQGSSSDATSVKSRNAQKEVEADAESTGGLEKVSREAMNFDLEKAAPDSEESKNSGQEHESGGKNNKQLQEAVDKFKKTMNDQTEAVFGIHEGTNRVTIKIVDKNTKDVLKEYPPEKTLDMIQKVWEMAGIMVDEKK